MTALSKGTTYATGNQVTATGLNNLVDAATFASGAVDNVTTAIDGTGAIIVKDLGVKMAKLESATNGQIPIGNGSGFTKATLTAGAGIAITNASGAITITNTNSPALIYNCTSQLDSTSTTFADIPGMSASITASDTYLIDGLIVAQNTTASSGCKISITGTATATSVSGVAFSGTRSGFGAPQQITAIGTTISAASIDGTYFIQFSAIVQCATSGTVKIQFAQAAASGGTSSALLGSYMRIATL